MAGWELFAEQRQERDFYSHSYRIAAKSPDNKLVISGQLNIPAEVFFKGGFGMTEILYHQGFEMQTYRATDQVYYHQMSYKEVDSWNSLAPFDGFAQIPMVPELKSFADFKLFNFNSTAPNEIYIPSNSVDECLDRILQLQYPKQQEIKKGLILPDAKPIVQAKIYSLAA